MAARAGYQSGRGVLLGAGGGEANARRQEARVDRQHGVGTGLERRKGVVAYTVSKAAVVQLTKALALELAFKGVRVNAIAPGYIVTEINRDWLAGEGAKMTREIPVGRFGEEKDLDGAMLLLASDAGSYITGETIVVDGGQIVGIRGG